MLVNWQHNSNDGICYDFLLETSTLFEQCTYLGYLLLEAPRKYVEHGPLLSINWLRFCPQFGACVRSHAVQRRLFIVLMTAAHISPNVFSLRNFLSNICVLFTAIHTYCTSHSNNIYILLLWDNHSVISSIPPGRPTALGLLCPIQVLLDMEWNTDKSRTMCVIARLPTIILPSTTRYGVKHWQIFNTVFYCQIANQNPA